MALWNRALAFAALVFVLSACSHDSTTPMMLRFLHAQTFGKGGVNYTREQAQAIPYATIGLAFGGAPREIVLLESVSGRDHRWMTANPVVIATRGGRIIKTAGLEFNLSAMSFAGRDPVDGTLHRLNAPLTVERFVDFSQERLLGVPVRCTFKPRGARDIRILEEVRPTLKITERCRAPYVHWTFTNIYWVDPQSGFVLRSVQHVHPEVPKVTFEVLRPSTVR